MGVCWRSPFSNFLNLIGIHSVANRACGPAGAQAGNGPAIPSRPLEYKSRPAFYFKRPGRETFAETGRKSRVLAAPLFQQVAGMKNLHQQRLILPPFVLANSHEGRMTRFTRILAISTLSASHEFDVILDTIASNKGQPAFRPGLQIFPAGTPQ